MKKTFLFILSAIAFNSYGQSIQKAKKSKTIGHDDAHSFMLGVGLGTNNIETLPFYMNMDYFATNDFSLGYQMILGSHTESVNNWDYQNFNYSFGLTANYHLNTLLNISYAWDFYIGANGGYNIGEIASPKDWNAPDIKFGSNSKFYGGGQVGARYYFTEILSVNLEGTVGSFRSGGNIGLTLQF